MPGYISEKSNNDIASQDFIEIAVPAGTDVSSYSIEIYDKSGYLVQTFSFGTVASTSAGQDVYLFDDTTPGWSALAKDVSIGLVDDQGDVLQFLGSDKAAVAQDGSAVGMTSTVTGKLEVGQSYQSDNSGGTYYVQGSPNAGTVPCYAPGTLIYTPSGLRAVETLQVGDLVNTLDHGPQPIRWTRRGEQPLEDRDTEGKPVLIAAGALGRGLPAQDLIVSPQHRMFVGGAGQLDGWFKSEAFVPAKSLTGLRGIRHMKGKTAITWIHFACDRHEVVKANGCLSESLLLGPMVINGLTRSERKALSDIYGPAPTNGDALNGSAARECLKVGEVRRHLAKYRKDKEQRIAKDIRKWDVDLAMETYEADRLHEACA